MYTYVFIALEGHSFACVNLLMSDCPGQIVLLGSCSFVCSSHKSEVPLKTLLWSNPITQFTAIGHCPAAVKLVASDT